MNMLQALTLAAIAAGAADVGSLLRSLDPPDGFVMDGEVAVYPADRLWDYINGGADAYLRNGVLETAALSIRRPSESLPSITIDLHRMSASNGAEAIFGEEKSPTAESLKLGSGGAWQSGLLSFWDGPYYARIVTQTTRDSTLACAEALARLLPTRLEPMPIFRLFPHGERVSDSETRSVKPYLGIHGMTDVYSMRFRDSAGEYELFLRKNRPPLTEKNVEKLGKIASMPTRDSPIQKIDLEDGRVLLLFYIKMCPYMAGYLGPKPDQSRIALLGQWVEGLPKRE